MIHKRSLLKKILVTVVLPGIVIFFVMAGISMLVVSNNIKSLSVIQNRLLLIDTIGLIAMIGVIVFGIKKSSNKITMIVESVNRLSNKEEREAFKVEKFQDQLDEVIYILVDVEKNLECQAEAAKNLAEGKLSVCISPASENDRLGNNLLAIQKTIETMFDYFKRLPELVENEEYVRKNQEQNIKGDYKNAIEQVDQAITTAIEKKEFFQDILDAMPYRITVVNNDLKWLFINKTVHDLRIASGAKESRQSLYGLDCCKSNLVMCKTEDCGVKAFKKTGRIEFPFEYKGEYFRNDTLPIKNKSGETIGYIETAIDITSTMSVNHYLKIEIQRLAENLGCLAAGNLDFDMNIQDPDKYTVEVCEQFKAIATNLNNVKNSIGNLIGDVTMLTTAAIDGELGIRANELNFKGSWRDLISGMNNILEEVSKPLEEVVQVVNRRLEAGDLSVTVNGHYKGSFNALKEAINLMGSGFLAVITDISTVTREIGNGNLNIENVRAFIGDFHTISSDLNAIIATLNRLLGEINNAAEQVNAGANQISDSGQSLAQGSTKQASSIQELTASIAEITDQTKHNAVDANKARELAIDVKENADKGNHQMTEMQRSMIDINKSSQDISKIIKVIDDIAFQTNILALNAAVEAARAGQHGKGFAVVAEEVRTLAARSAEAAKETTDLIEGSIKSVAEGTQIANDTATALAEIVAGIAQVTNLIGNIATASNEQATGIAQINMGIEQVAQVVQQNSATAEQSAAASEELSSQAVLLKQMIEQFQLRN